MSTITQVEPQKKNPKRFNIFIDGAFAFGVDEDLVINQRLIVGKIIKPGGLDKLLYEVGVGKLMERIYGLFSVRSRSEKEVRDYLKNLSYKRKLKDKQSLRDKSLQDEISEASIDLIIERLKQKNMLNDLEFAKVWVEGRRRSKQKSIRALKTELMQKGINREIVEEAVSSQSSVVSEEELARLALEKKIRIWENLPSEELKKKTIEFLLRKGFDYELIKDVVEKILEIR